MSASVRLPKTRVTLVLSAGFLKMARASWYILFRPALSAVFCSSSVVGLGGGGGGGKLWTYGVIPVPPAIKAI